MSTKITSLLKVVIHMHIAVHDNISLDKKVMEINIYK